MPSEGIQRAWSTQYGEDYNTRKLLSWKWKQHISGKKYHRKQVARPNVPRATDLVAPQLTRAYITAGNGLYEPMLDHTMVSGQRVIPYSAAHNTVLDDVQTTDCAPVVHVPEDVDPVTSIPEPIPLRRHESPELHWICWPEKKTKRARRHTSQGFHTDRSNYSVNQSPRNAQNLNTGQPVKYEPKIQSWTNVSAENERKAVDAMFSMRRSQSFYEPSQRPLTSISINEPPPKDKYTKYGGQVVDPKSLYQQNFFPYFQAHGSGPRDAMALQQLVKEMEGKQPTAFNYNYSFNKYPLHMRRNKPTAAKTDDYVHERSMFMTTTPQCSGHFIIHPDWVSERSGLRRSKSMLQLTNTSRM